MRNQNKCYDDSYLVKQNTKRFLKFGGTGLNPAENQYISFFSLFAISIIGSFRFKSGFLHVCVCVFRHVLMNIINRA